MTQSNCIPRSHLHGGLVGALALASLLAACHSLKPPQRGEPVDTTGADPLTWPPDRAVTTEHGPVVTVIEAPAEPTAELERRRLAQLPTTESLLAELREAVAGIDEVAIVRGRAETAAAPVEGYELAASRFSILEGFGDQRVASASIRIVQHAPEGELHLDVGFFPTPGRDYLLILRRSALEKGAYEIVRTRTILGYASRFDDGSYRFDVPTAPAVTPEQLLKALSP